MIQMMDIFAAMTAMIITLKFVQMFQMNENPKPTIYRNKNHFEFY